jgi:NAD(P)-dependent dehydrogenase (short-subunit alcohol dehydrogenase family)
MKTTGLSIDLQGKRAFVSGVSSGIGAAIAAVLAKTGCDVAGCGRSAASSPGVQAFHQSIQCNGRRSVYFEADFTEAEAPARAIAAAQDSLGGIDILVSNAGLNVFAGAAACSETDWGKCMNLDLAAHWRLAQAAQPFLKQARGGGVILVITSNHAWNTIAGCFPYNVAKAGLLALVQSLAIEWGPAIRTVGIAPGFVDTAGNQAWFDRFPDPVVERARTEALHPVGRMGSVEEIAMLAAFLASPLAGFISGTTVLADGGRSALMQDALG